MLFTMRLHISIIFAPLLLSACDLSGAPLPIKTPPPCDSERMVEGWTVTAGVERARDDDSLIGKWEARRSYSTFFELRITYDTNESTEPFLQIWHDYKTGEFLMRLTEKSQFRMYLDAQYAITRGTLPPGAFDIISRRPVRIEHTSHTNKWSVYQTSGLPEAIVEAQADLESAKQLLAAGKCSPKK